MDRLNSIRRDQRWRTSAHLSVTCRLLCQEMPALLKDTRQIAIVGLFCKGVVSSHISKATSVIEELRKTSTWHGNLRQLINLDPSRIVCLRHCLVPISSEAPSIASCSRSSPWMFTDEHERISGSAVVLSAISELWKDTAKMYLRSMNQWCYMQAEVQRCSEVPTEIKS